MGRRWLRRCKWLVIIQKYQPTARSCLLSCCHDTFQPSLMLRAFILRDNAPKRADLTEGAYSRGHRQSRQEPQSLCSVFHAKPGQGGRWNVTLANTHEQKASPCRSRKLAPERLAAAARQGPRAGAEMSSVHRSTGSRRESKMAACLASRHIGSSGSQHQLGQ